MKMSPLARAVSSILSADFSVATNADLAAVATLESRPTDAARELLRRGKEGAECLAAAFTARAAGDYDKAKSLLAMSRKIAKTENLPHTLTLTGGRDKPQLLAAERALTEPKAPEAEGTGDGADEAGNKITSDVKTTAADMAQTILAQSIRIEELETENAKLRARIAELESVPAAPRRAVKRAA